jgi:hypothetical protein
VTLGAVVAPTPTISAPATVNAGKNLTYDVAQKLNTYNVDSFDQHYAKWVQTINLSTNVDYQSLTVKNGSGAVVVDPSNYTTSQTGNKLTVTFKAAYLNTLNLNGAKFHFLVTTKVPTNATDQSTAQATTTATVADSRPPAAGTSTTAAKTTTTINNKITINSQYLDEATNKPVASQTTQTVPYGQKYTAKALTKNPGGYLFDFTKGAATIHGTATTATTHTFYYARKVPVTIHYYNLPGTAKVAPNKKIYAMVGHTYDFSPIQAPQGYEYRPAKTKGAHVTVTSQTRDAYFYYESMVRTVTVVNREWGTKKLLNKTSVPVAKDDNYTTGASDYLDDYSLDTAHLPKNAAGVGGTNPVTVTYYYRPLTTKWAQVANGARVGTSRD